jgi:putative transposase
VALRYVERNPVRAGLVKAAGEWSWSSAGVHCGTSPADPHLEVEGWRQRWTSETWRAYLAEGEREEDLAAVRRCTHTGRPLGAAEFVERLEGLMQRPLAPQKGGRPKKRWDESQTALPFDR